MQIHVLICLFCGINIIFCDSLSGKFSNSLIYWLEYNQYISNEFGQSLNLSLMILPIKTGESEAGVKTWKLRKAKEQAADLPP